MNTQSIITTSPAPTTSPSLDTTLAAYEDARKATEAHSTALRHVEQAYFDQCAALGPAPVEREMTADERAAFNATPVGELSKVPLPHYAEHRAAMAAWGAACKKIARATGHAAAEREFNRLVSAECRLARKVLAFPVVTLEGLAAKMAVHAKFVFNSDELADAVARDVKRILREAEKCAS